MGVNKTAEKTIRFSVVEQENRTQSWRKSPPASSSGLQAATHLRLSIMPRYRHCAGGGDVAGVWLSLPRLANAFDDIQAFNASLIGKLLLFGWSFALFYHLCNGIRHLFWDAGKGFGLEAAYRNGWLVVVASVR